MIAKDEIASLAKTKLKHKNINLISKGSKYQH